ncbi:hypothetical protein HRI_000535100 [Hibiscus trionum]|uniref:Uncharacterized protein n=1 Tax=Hibiscus trionum TaxID=183268 RepID=A0A9W7LL11_HIBTR|nr:hypothetical protein HRI_000535100 [Hibiscus trionum]
MKTNLDILVAFSAFCMAGHQVDHLRMQKISHRVPLALLILGHLHLLKVFLHRTLFSLSQKNGLPFLCRRLLPSVVEQFYTKNDIVSANRCHFIIGKYVGYNYTTFGLAPYDDHWQNLWKLSSVKIFSSTRLNISMDIRRDEKSIVYCSNCTGFPGLR